MQLVTAGKLSKVPESLSLVKQSRGTAVLCNACQSMFDGPRITFSHSESESESQTGRCHHPTRDSMQAAVQAGCDLCGILWDLWQTGLLTPNLVGGHNNLDRQFPSYVINMTSLDSRCLSLSLWIRNLADESDWHSICSQSGTGIYNILNAGISFYLHPQDGANRFSLDRCLSFLNVR